MRQWTDDEASRFIDFLKAEAPTTYEEYVQQEIKSGVIESDLWREMTRLAGKLFPGVDFRELGRLLVKVRGHMQRTLGLRPE